MAGLSPTRSILVADDDSDFRGTVADYLRDGGYRVVEAGDGAEALAFALQQPFDVVITDLRMPGLDGLQLLDRLGQVQPETAFIFFSGSAGVSDAIAALKHGQVHDFLLKPLRTFESIDAALERALAARVQRRMVARPTDPLTNPDPAPYIADGASLVGRTLRYLAVHYPDRTWLQRTCTHVGYSPNYLTGVLKQATDMSLQRWVTAFRLSAARYLLESTDLPVARIAEEVGLTDAKSLVRVFRQVHGQTPTEWRQGATPQDSS